MQQNSGPSRTENNFHLTRGSFARVELQDRLPRRFFGEEFGILVSEEKFESDAPAAARTPPSRIGLGVSNTRHVHAGQRLGILREGSVGAYDQNIPQLVAVAGPNFLNAWIVPTGGLVRPHHKLNLGRDLGIDRWQSYGIEAASRSLLKAGHRR